MDLGRSDALDWVAVEARTGRQIAFLPELKSAPLVRTLGRPDSLTLALPLAGAPENWRRATKRFGVWLVALVDDQPVYGCLIVKRRVKWSADPDASIVQIDAMTAEGYLDRRYVGDVDYGGVGHASVDQNVIVADLIARFVADGAGGLPGIPMTVVVEGPAGSPRARTYRDVDDRTVLSAVDDLAGLVGGPEWTVEWTRTDDPRPTFTPVLHVGNRIGTDPRDHGLAPVTFELPGCVTTATLEESYEDGKGANRATATGEKSGDDRAQVTVDDLSDTDLPLAELRGSASTSNGDDGDDGSLEDHARGALEVTATGGLALSLTAPVSEAPALGGGSNGTWRIGDTVGVDLSTPDGGGQGSFRDAFRCIGWQWDTTVRPETVTPVLYVPESVL